MSLALLALEPTFLTLLGLAMFALLALLAWVVASGETAMLTPSTRSRPASESPVVLVSASSLPELLPLHRRLCRAGISPTLRTDPAAAHPLTLTVALVHVETARRLVPESF